MDAIPGIISYYWFEPNKIGEYEVLCAEYCGVGHYAMRAKVIVESEGNYKNWINEQETFSDLIAKQENDKLKTTLIVKNNN
jgi:cytochrome c oxidase subunit 2